MKRRRSSSSSSSKEGCCEEASNNDNCTESYDQKDKGKRVRSRIRGASGGNLTSSPVVVVADPSTFSSVVQRLTGMSKPDIPENKEGYNENAMKKPLLFKPVPTRPTIDQVTGKSSPGLSSLVHPAFTSSHSPPLLSRPEDDLYTTLQGISKFLEED